MKPYLRLFSGVVSALVVAVLNVNTGCAQPALPGTNNPISTNYPPSTNYPCSAEFAGINTNWPLATTKLPSGKINVVDGQLAQSLAQRDGSVELPCGHAQ
jgi:hypothetical protein